MAALHFAFRDQESKEKAAQYRLKIIVIQISN